MTSDQIDNEDELMIHETEALESLRSRGFACIVWTPSELGSAPSKHVECRLVELGWDVIDALKDE